jgi:hypothetical protein
MTNSNRHVAAYVQDTDPGDVGAGKFWVSLSAPYFIKVRNSGNSDWNVIAWGGLRVSAPITGDVTLDATNDADIFLMDGSISNIELTLPPATVKRAAPMTFLSTTTPASHVRIWGAGADTIGINAVAQYDMSALGSMGGKFTIYPDGVSSWIVLDNLLIPQP